MSDFFNSGWSVYIAAVTIVGLVACLALLVIAARRRVMAGDNTTGHVWDEDLRELNNPLPRWWMWLFVLTVVFSGAYLVYYPGLGSLPGTAGWTSVKEYRAEQALAKAATAPLFASFAAKPASELAPFQLDVPADPSSAAFFAALAAAGGVRGGAPLELTDVALNPTRLGFFRVLRDMGADVAWEVHREECGEPVGTITVAPRGLQGVEIGGDQVPAMIDELPMLACLGALGDGVIEIRGASELRVKESDRIAAVVQNLRDVGADADELPDGLRVRGGTRSLGGAVQTHGDHRLAMAFGVLGALSGNAITVDDPDCVSVSYPGFWSDLERVTS